MAEQSPQFLDALSYNATADRAFWHDFMRDSNGLEGTATDGGVVTSTDMNVTQNGTPNMTVNVASGVAYVRGDTTPATQGMYRCYNDATVNKGIAAAHATLGRNDLVVAHAYDNIYDSSGSNLWALEVVTGTPSSSPVDPTPPISTLKLARVFVGAAVTTIVNANITSLKPTIAPMRRGGIVDNDGSFSKYLAGSQSGDFTLRFHFGGPQTFTTDSGGYQTVTHGAGFTPVYVHALWSGQGIGGGPGGVAGTDSYTSTTFRYRNTVASTQTMTMRWFALG